MTTTSCWRSSRIAFSNATQPFVHRRFRSSTAAVSFLWVRRAVRRRARTRAAGARVLKRGCDLQPSGLVAARMPVAASRLFQKLPLSNAFLGALLASNRTEARCCLHSGVPLPLLLSPRSQCSRAHSQKGGSSLAGRGGGVTRRACTAELLKESIRFCEPLRACPRIGTRSPRSAPR